MTAKKQLPSPPQIRFHAAIEDSDGYFIDDSPFMSDEGAIERANELNRNEVNRFQPGHQPDAVWFVMKVDSRFTVHKMLQAPDQEEPLKLRSNEQVRVMRKTRRLRVIRNKAS